MKHEGRLTYGLLGCALTVALAAPTGAQPAPFPRGPAVDVGVMDQSTDQLVGARRSGGGFALGWTGAGSTASGGSVTLVAIDGAGQAGATLDSIARGPLDRLAAADTLDGFVVAFLTTSAFSPPTLEVRSYGGLASTFIAEEELTDGALGAYRLTGLGDGVAAVYDDTGAAFDLDESTDPESFAEITDGVGERGAIAGTATDLFAFVVVPGAGDEGLRIDRFRVRDGAVIESDQPVFEGRLELQAPFVASAPWGFQLAWRNAAAIGLAAERFGTMQLDRTGRPVGGGHGLALVGHPEAELRQLRVDGSGRIWTLWRDGAELLLAVFDRTQVSAPATRVATGSLAGETLVLGDGGANLVAWLDQAGGRVRAQVFEECSSGGEDGVTALCLQSGQFTAELTFRLPSGEEGIGQPVTDRSVEAGLFWFFSPDNWEFLVKVLDTCALNGHRWVFAAPTTDIGFTLTVTEVATGKVKTYDNPVGTLPTVINDTGAFACP